MSSAIRTTEQAEQLAASLQREFEYLAGNVNLPVKILEAKKRQISQVEVLVGTFREIFDGLCDVDDYITKLQACLLFHGVSPLEIEQFTRWRVSICIEELRQIQKTGVCQIPESIRPLLDVKKCAELRIYARASRHWRMKELIRKIKSGEIQSGKVYEAFESLERALDRSERAAAKAIEDNPPPVFADRPAIPYEALRQWAGHKAA